MQDEFNLLPFFMEEVHRIKDVHPAETFVVYKTFNLKAPNIL
jgi:Lrp/AsnC family transcriptional regulator, regulator for asnA, asnC and gidA